MKCVLSVHKIAAEQIWTISSTNAGFGKERCFFTPNHLSKNHFKDSLALWASLGERMALIRGFSLTGWYFCLAGACMATHSLVLPLSNLVKTFLVWLNHKGTVWWMKDETYTDLSRQPPLCLHTFLSWPLLLDSSFFVPPDIHNLKSTQLFFMPFSPLPTLNHTECTGKAAKSGTLVHHLHA